MRSLVVLLLLLFAVQTYGVVGAWQTQGIRRKCTMPIGPLCYAWEESAVSKLLGEDKLDDIEDALEDAKEKWETEVVDKLVKKGGSIEKVLDDVADMAKEGAENAKKVIEEKVK